MMNEYVNRKTAIEIVKSGGYWEQEDMEVAIACIEQTPTADVVEVVKCKDCKHWHKKAFDPIVEHDIGECHCAHWENDYFSYETLDNDFCSYGERSDA